jgi:hypothetical protein
MTAILFRDRLGRGNGDEILIRGAAIGTKSLASHNLGIDPRSLVLNNDLAKRARKGVDAIWDERVPADLRGRVIDMAKRIQAMPDNAPGGTKFWKERGELAKDVLAADLPAKLQRSLLQMILDNAPITSLNSDPYEGAQPYPGDGEVYPGKAAGAKQFDKLLRKIYSR